MLKRCSLPVGECTYDMNTSGFWRRLRTGREKNVPVIYALFLAINS